MNISRPFGPAAAARSQHRRRLDGAGADAVAAHALGDEVDGDRAGQRRDRGLGRAIDVAVRRGLEHAGGGGDVDDRAAARFQHAGQERADRPVHRFDVEVERKIPILVGAIEHGAVMHEAGGIEQDVGLAGALGHRGDGCAVARVEFCDFRDAFALERRKLALVDIGGKHGGAFARKGQRAGAADARRGRGHECALALQAV